MSLATLGSVMGEDFLLEKTLAEDETSVVVAARHLKLDRPVALRVLASGDSDRGFLSRFARAKLVKNDHLPELIEVGSLADGRPYVVMECLSGTSLHQVLARGRLLALPDAVDYVMQACDAIAAAHAVGLAHRKLRTSSLFLTQGPNGQMLVKVLNLGLGGRTVSAGTPLSARAAAYFAPEQFTDPQHADARCDIWALGVILYELLTGKRPFDARSAEKVEKRVLTEVPKSPHALRGEIPVSLQDIVVRCLSKSPAHRFESVVDLANALVPFASPLTRNLPARMPRPAAEPAGRRSSVSRATGATGVTGAAPAQPASTAPPRVSDPPSRDDDGENPTLVRGVPPTKVEDAQEEIGFRKITKGGRIEALDSDAVALAVRSKRVAAEASLLADRAASMPAKAPQEEDEDDGTISGQIEAVGLGGAGQGGQGGQPGQAGEGTGQLTRASHGAAPVKASIFVLVLLIAAITGVTLGLLTHMILKMRRADARQGQATTSVHVSGRG